jgi:hypothetical protein
MKNNLSIPGQPVLRGIIYLYKSPDLTRNLQGKKYLCRAIVFLAALIFPVLTAPAATFTNPAQINFPLNTEITSLYPSPITVSGLTGPIASTPGSVKVTINVFTHTFPSQAAMALCSPGGACFLLQAVAGGNSRVDNVTYTLSDLGADALPQTTSLTAGTYRPAAYDLRTFPAPGPGNASQNPGPVVGGTATLTSAFHGISPNGTWKLYALGGGGAGRIDNGWTLELQTDPVAHPQHVLDFDGDGNTDYVIARNLGGANGPVRWVFNLNGSTTNYGSDWGLSSDYLIPADYDGDQKTDIAVWRSVSSGQPAGNAFFYILNSSNNTVRIEDFGQTGDDPTVVGDYNGDGRADVAVYRAGAGAGQPSFWFYRTAAGGAVNYVQWGLGGSFLTPGDRPAPGDYDGDGKNDFVIVRNNSGFGQSQYWLDQTTAGFSTRTFGVASDALVPGDYDGDGKTDLAIARPVSGNLQWWYLRSSDSQAVQTVFGTAATDYTTPGDYDGDGRTDVAIWRTSTTPGTNAFWVRGSLNGASVVPFGQSGDYPVANFNSH